MDESDSVSMDSDIVMDINQIKEKKRNTQITFAVLSPSPPD